MSDTKWTPGVFSCSVGECVKVRDESGSLIATLSHINHFGKRRNQDEVAATGKLLASAPMLYEALQEMIDWANSRPGTFPGGYPGDRAAKALAAARGEQS